MVDNYYVNTHIDISEQKMFPLSNSAVATLVLWWLRC